MKTNSPSSEMEVEVTRPYSYYSELVITVLSTSRETVPGTLQLGDVSKTN
jgi:hypothetical protein